ncbi:MAG: Na+/galactose cotransporter, partial [Proteobacteria bacterium]|nr:Na+/galactose cotransporter [Pseudomonadota bacterium]
TVWTYDIYQSIINKKASPKTLLWMGRAATIVAVILSVGTAYWAKSMPTIMDYMQAIFSWVNAPLFATMLLGMFWKRCTSTGAFYGLLAGMGSSFLMFIGLKFAWFSSYWLTFSQNASDMSNNLWRAWWAWLICFVVTILISLVTKPKSDKELEGLVKGLTPNPDLEKVPLIKRPTFWAAISLVVAIILNIYFW